MASQERQDFFMAYSMHEKLNCLGVTENAISPQKKNYKPRTLIDHTLELIDPTPNIHTLFMQFNERFFWNVLLPVEVKWSNRMTSCAGVCTFHSRSKQCVISLSAPLLKLRPRKDLIETLLHEMIHGYLFLTNNDRDRDGHGPNFCKHMHRINKEAGTNITIYHNFHDEVKLYQQHWWKCNGPCQHKPPFFGTVRRAMNRSPGPSDFWWHEHQQNCNGQFIKIREPENFKSRSKQSSESKTNAKNKNLNKSIADWFTKNTTKSMHTKNNQESLVGIKKLGNTSNNIHGWGTNNPNEKVEKSNIKSNVLKTPKFSCSGTLGGNNNGQSNLLTKFLHIEGNKNRDKLAKKDLSSKILVTQKKIVNDSIPNSSKSRNDSISCCICNISISLKDIDTHLDLCLINNNSKEKNIIGTNINDKCESKSELFINKHSNNIIKLMSPIRKVSTEMVKPINDAFSNKRLKLDDLDGSRHVNCPVCNKTIPSAHINQHLDDCLLETDTIHKPSSSSNSYLSNNSIINISSSSNSDLDNSVFSENSKPVELSTDVSTITTSKYSTDTSNLDQKCLVCNAHIPHEISLNEHLDECIGAVFNDDSIATDDENDNNDTDNSNTSIIKNISIENNYPCPVCMQIISENLMNQHLDTCLNK